MYEENPEAVSGLPAKGEVVELLGSVRLPPEGDLDQHVVIVENNEEGLTIKEYEDEPPKPKLKSSILKKPGRPPIDNKGFVCSGVDKTGYSCSGYERELYIFSNYRLSCFCCD